MALEALASNEFLNFIIYDTISATPQHLVDSTTCTDNSIPHSNIGYPMEQEMNNVRQQAGYGCLNGTEEGGVAAGAGPKREGLGVQGAVKKRRRKPRVCKNKEEAETQRMTHIAVERNRRKQMNEHLAVLRSLIPDSYVQRGDQASIVGGAIEYVKELEHLLQSLEAQKFHLLQRLGGPNGKYANSTTITTTSNNSNLLLTPFSKFFVCPQYTWSQLPNNKFTSKTKASIANIEVALIETHASMRILSRRNPRQLSKLVGGLQTLHLSILHINVTTMDNLVLYSISAKLDEGCRLNTVDDIAGAVHHMLRIIEEEADFVDQPKI